MKCRGFVIFVVLIAIIAMAAGLTSMLAGVRGQSGTVRAIVERQEARLAARSAAMAIEAELEDQREQMLAGELPTLSEAEDVLRFEEDLSWQWEILSEDDGWDGVEPLAVRLDVNHADADVLTALCESGEIDAESLLAGRPYRTLGMIEHAAGASEFARQLTVLSVDPPLRSGAGGQPGLVGQGRIVPGDGGEAPVGVSSDAGKLYVEIAEGSVSVASRADILRAMVSRSVPTEDWDVLLDAFDFHEGEPAKGLVDLARASESVLASLPGLDEDVASTLAGHRDGLTRQDLAGLSWPVRDELVSIEDYAQVIDLLTTRSLQYRVRFAIHREVIESEGDPLGFDQDLADERGPLCVYDMVVDLSGERPRVAYLRDSTFGEWAARKVVSDTDEAGALSSSTDVDDAMEVFTGDIQSGESGREDQKPVESVTPGQDDAGVLWGRYPAGGQG